MIDSHPKPTPREPGTLDGPGHSRLTGAERKRVLFEWNDTAAEYPRDRCFHRLFEDQVGRTPAATAVVFGRDTLTYEHLNARANAMAHRLQSMGVGPEALVAIFMERSIEMLVALLAVLKAGGAYVPLDPTYPSSRLEFMLKDCGSRVLLTQRRLEGRLPTQGLEVLYAEEESVPPEAVVQNPDSGVKSENLAYVIYTSGSTGQPKGALIPHRGLVNYLSWAIRAYEVAAGEGAPVHSSLSFDLTVTSLLAPLLVGRRVQLLPPGEGVESLAEALQTNEQFSLIKITPAHLELLSQQLPAGQASGHARFLVVGGENLLAENLRFWRESAPETVVINEYGPTETVVGCCVYRVPSGGELTGSVPIGRPISNTQLYVLDESLEPVAIGDEGELFIGGDGVARGYLNQPLLTAQKFLPDPFRNEHGGCLYRTGDRVRYRPDGNLEFLGRLDDQVKIRGYRIELGEIESVLMKHPSVGEAVVVARGEAHASRSIVAYLVPERDEALDVSLVGELARLNLPTYMVPSAFVVLKSLPLTPNGKVDRRALPAPERAERGIRAEYRPPVTSRERRLTSIFESVFEIQPIGIGDDFFALGGNSLTAARVLTGIQKAFGKRISPAVLLRAPTVESLARVVEEEPSKQQWTSLVPIQPEGSRRPLFCLHAGAGTILFYQELARTLGSDQPVYGLQARGLYGDASPQATVEEMASHYIREMRTVQPSGPYALAGFCFGAILAFEMAHQLLAAGETVGLLVSLDGAAPHYDYSADAQTRESSAGASVVSKISREWMRLLALPANRRLQYVRQKVVNQWIARTIKSQYRLGEWLRERGRPVPAAIRRFYFLWHHEETERKYQPKVYPGRMVIFETAGLFHDRNLGWKDLLGEGLEIHEIAGEHKAHRDLLTGDFVRSLSDELTRLLHAVEAPDPRESRASA